MVRQSHVRRGTYGSGPRCTAPKCGKPIEQNTKIAISPRDPMDVRHVRCAPATWLNK